MAVNLIDGNTTRIETLEDNIKMEITFPVGYIYISTNNINPSTYFGGTWERIAKGKTLVGVDEEDTDFNASLKTGGEKTHTLTVDEMPSHSHPTLGNGNVASVGSGSFTSALTGGASSRHDTENTGGGQSHNNMQPYLTVYMWEKVN